MRPAKRGMFGRKHPMSAQHDEEPPRSQTPSRRGVFGKGRTGNISNGLMIAGAGLQDAFGDTRGNVQSTLAQIDGRQNAEWERQQYEQAQLQEQQQAAQEAQRRQALIGQLGLDPKAAAQFELTDKLPERPTYFAPVETSNGFTQFANDGSDPRAFEDVQAPKPQLDEYQLRQLELQERKFAHQQQNPRNGISIGPDGTVQIGGPAGGQPLGRAGQGTNARELSAARETASTADATLQLANQARSIIEGPVNPDTGEREPGFNSGALAGVRGEFGRLAGDLGFGDGAPDYEQFKAVNNQLAAQMLKLFGGSDTEKELAISMASNIGPSFSEETNRRMLDQMDAMINAQRRKPEFQAQWINRLGSLDAIDPASGLGFQGSWDRTISALDPSFAGASSPSQQAAVEAGTSGALAPDEQSELERLRAKYKGGN